MTARHVQAQEPVPVSSSNNSTEAGTSDESFDDGVQALSGEEESDDNSHENNQPKAKKVVKKGADEKGADEKGPRVVVDNNHVASLVREYRRNFAEFSKGKKKKPKQLIPNKVWNKVYTSYKKQFPKSKFKQESLKIHLRESLTNLQSGVNNPKAENQEGAELQDITEMRELNQTEGFLRRKWICSL